MQANKFFTIWSKEIEGRLDCDFYRPEFNELNKKVRNITKRTLGDFMVSMAGGATPDIKESQKYYTELESGIPFLRVQNITPQGLNLEDVKHINQETNEGILKRSQVKEFDLIVKITGVGRMAVSSVAPKGFKGNINQHLVVIKTESEEVSKVLATFLNSDIGERLAKKLSTGGTRPALDYTALKSIPVVFKPEIVEIMEKAYSVKKAKEQEAENILNTIDNHTLTELGIVVKNVKDKNCFSIDSNEIANKRLDPKGYLDTPQIIKKALAMSKYKTEELSKIIDKSIAGEWGEDPEGFESNKDYTLVKVLRNTNFDNLGNLNFDEVAERFVENKKLEKVELKKGDILIEKSGGSPTQPVGRVALIEDLEGKFTFSNFLQSFRLKKECLPEYLFCFLKALYGLNYMEYLQNQTTGIKNLIMEEYLLIPVPLPPPDIQKEIADKFRSELTKADKLKSEAAREIEKAKQEVEEIILENGK